MKKKSQPKKMEIKRPSLKGQKNMGYLGHFAQDKYIQKGHNLSGQFPMFREPSQLEMMGPANPFDAMAERKRREAEVNVGAQAVEASTPDTSAEMAKLQRDLDKYKESQQTVPRRPGDGEPGRDYRELLERRLASATERSRSATVNRYRQSRKKFIEEL